MILCIRPIVAIYHVLHTVIGMLPLDHLLMRHLFYLKMCTCSYLIVFNCLVTFGGVHINCVQLIELSGKIWGSTCMVFCTAVPTAQ